MVYFHGNRTNVNQRNTVALPPQGRPASFPPVKTSAPFRKLCALVCVALALVFTGAGAATVIIDVQHMTGASGNHEQVLFSNISLDDRGQDSYKHSGHHGGHHHHGDIAAGMPLLQPTGIATPIATGDRNPLMRDHLRISIALPQPERPPRA